MRVMAPPPTPADPVFVARFLSRVGPDIAASFTPAQLDAIHTAFALRSLPRHSLDIRRSVPTPWGRIYIAIVAGRERRSQARTLGERLLRRGSAVFDIAMLFMLAVLLLMIGAGALYLLKIALGIDLIPGIDMLPDAALLRVLRS